MRIGELLYASLTGRISKKLLGDDRELLIDLFYISDEDLIRIVKDYLAAKKTKESVEEYGLQ